MSSQTIRLASLGLTNHSSFPVWSMWAGERVYKYWVWLGVYQVGSPDKLWLRERGVTQSHGEGRLPPLEPSYWRDVCSETFIERSNLVCMSDSCVAYTSKPWTIGIVDARHVNNSMKTVPEFALSV